MRFHRQDSSLKPVAAIQKNHGLERIDLELLRGPKFFSQQLLDAGRAIGAIRGKPFQHRGQRSRHHIACPPGNNPVHRRVPERLNDIHAVPAAEIAKVNAPGKPLLAVRVAAPIRGDDVHASVAVKIACGNPVPKPGKLAKVCRGARTGHGNFPRHKSAVIVAKEPKRPPFTRQHEVGVPVAVEIAEHRAADHPDTR